MKKITYTFLTMLILLLSQGTLAEVTNTKLVFKDYGAWRDSQNGQGEYELLTSDWNSCVKACLESAKCKGIEFTINAQPRVACELHSDDFHHALNKNGTNYVGTIWLKQ